MQSQLKALIVDDELHNRVVLEKMLQQHTQDIHQIFQAATIAEAIEHIKANEPDIVFLDIQMQGESGFDLLQQLPVHKFEVIFVTAYDNFAIKAFRFNAIDYLLKPVVVTELIEAVEKAIHRLGTGQKPNGNLSRLSQSTTKELTENLTIATADGFIVIPVRDIIYCQASGNYTIIHLHDKRKITCSQTLGYYEDLLADNNFFRTHRSYLVQLSHVSSYRKGEGGYILMSNGEEVELARNNKSNFMNLFKS